MAADSTGKASPGSPFRPPPATIWNNMVDAGRAFADGQLSSGPPGATRPRSTDTLRLKNSSGAGRRKGEILKIEGKVITDLTDESIWLDGVDVTDDCRFGILKDPAESNEVVAAQVSGMCLALVNVTDTDHTFAVAADGEHVLQSGESGPLEILFAPGGTGERECVVRFSGRRSTATAGGCGACNEPAGTNDIEVDENLIASEFYEFNPFCSGALNLLFTFDAGGTWLGSADGGMTVDCNGEDSTFTAAMVVNGHLPGEVVITLSDGVDDWIFVNDVSWQPDQNTPMVLSGGAATCPCSPLRQFPCLRPVNDPEV